MGTGERKDLNSVIPSISELLPELDPRIIEPSDEKQQELGIAPETLLLRVGGHRVMAVYPNNVGTWTIKEFDASTGGLVPKWEETGDFPDEILSDIVLGAAVRILEEQLAATGADALDPDVRDGVSGILATLRSRQ